MYYCSKCWSEIPEGAEYCPKCGKAAKGGFYAFSSRTQCIWISTSVLIGMLILLLFFWKDITLFLNVYTGEISDEIKGLERYGERNDVSITRDGDTGIVTVEFVDDKDIYEQITTIDFHCSYELRDGWEQSIPRSIHESQKLKPEVFLGNWILESQNGKVQLYVDKIDFQRSRITCSIHGEMNGEDLSIEPNEYNENGVGSVALVERYLEPETYYELKAGEASIYFSKNGIAIGNEYRSAEDLIFTGE